MAPRKPQKVEQFEPSHQSGNRVLSDAKKAKHDEFYTQLVDIEKELKSYKEQLRGKTVFCNCDDPFESHFFKYFALNFNALGLKKLIATSYVPSAIAGSQLPLLEIEGLKPDGKEPFKIEINTVSDLNHDGATDLADVEYLLRHDANTATPLKGNGDFRSAECVELLKQADVIVTNPPFSLFREFVAQLVEHNKKFLIIGNVNAITYKDIFRLVKENRIWLGESIHSGDREFRVPDSYPLQAAGFRVDEKGVKYIRVKGVRWFTNMDVPLRHESLALYKKYEPEDYPKYDNYDAIEVSKVAEIPADYEGVMGVPITFLDKYNPKQFEILGLTSGRNEFDAIPTKHYTNPIQHNPDGSTSNGSKANTRATISQSTKPSDIYYTADNAKGYLSILYARIIIKRKDLV